VRAVNAYDVFLSGWRKRCVAVTGRVGKSTVVLWAAHLVGDAVAAGYAPEKSPVSVLGSRARVAILEADGGFTGSAPRLRMMSTDSAGAMTADPLINTEAFAAAWGAHNVPNIATAVHIARAVGVPVATIAKRLTSLPQLPQRQEVVHRDAKLTVINDVLAVNPDAGIAAVRRWGGPTTILVTGGEGTAEYRLWADEVSARIRATNVIAMPGSATRAMRLALRRKGFVVPARETLEGALAAALARAATYVSATILVSPAALSPDHADLGQRLNAFVKRELS
jgi:UDP-N-acetylmuramoylalanine-D-glutamate ligase